MCICRVIEEVDQHDNTIYVLVKNATMLLWTFQEVKKKTMDSKMHHVLNH
jgi:hypothetical protein